MDANLRIGICYFLNQMEWEDKVPLWLMALRDAATEVDGVIEMAWRALFYPDHAFKFYRTIFGDAIRAVIEWRYEQDGKWAKYGKILRSQQKS